MTVSQLAHQYGAMLDKLEAAETYCAGIKDGAEIRPAISWTAGCACVGYKEMVLAVSALVGLRMTVLLEEALEQIRLDVKNSRLALEHALHPLDTICVRRKDEL